MAVYGTKFCMTCYGFGIKLRAAELTEIENMVLNGTPFSTIRRARDDSERCPRCKGMGWIFAAGCKHIILPNNVWDR